MALVDDDSNNNDAVSLTICYPPGSPRTLQLSLSLTGADLKARLPDILATSSDNATEWRLVCNGRVIQNERTLLSQSTKQSAHRDHIVANSKIYATKPNAASVVPNGTAPDASTMKRPDSGSGQLMAPILKFLSSNPELYQQLFLGNPQIQKLIESNPELRHALADPETLQTMLQAASNPSAYNEMLRGHDRALANLETIPEGFSHLKRLYSTVQEPMYEALASNPRAGRASGAAAGGRENSDERRLTSETMPNPWAPRMSSPSIRPQKPPPAPSPAFPPVSPLAPKPTPPALFDSPTPVALPPAPAGLSDFFQLMQQRNAAASISSPVAQPLDMAQLKSRFQSELATLHELGFEDDDGENIPALLATGGHVHAAIERILSRR